MFELLTPGYEALHTTMTFPPLARYNHMLRMRNVIGVMQQHQVEGLLDIGCGDGRFIRRSLKHGVQGPVMGIDTWGERLELAQASFSGRLDASRVRLIEGSMTDIEAAVPDVSALKSTGAVVLLETIEHVPLDLTPRVMSGVLGHVAPKIAIVTTPDATVPLTPEKMLARGHNFEWTIPEFEEWAHGIVEQNPDYSVSIEQITGSTFVRNTQMAVFARL